MVELRAPNTLFGVLLLVTLIVGGILAFYAVMRFTAVLVFLLVGAVVYGLYALGFRFDRLVRGL